MNNDVYTESNIKIASSITYFIIVDAIFIYN